MDHTPSQLRALEAAAARSRASRELSLVQSLAAAQAANWSKDGRQLLGKIQRDLIDRCNKGLT